MVEDEVVEHLKERLHRALKAKAILLERSKQLAQQVEDLKRRDDRSTHVVEELLNRQRELNYMLHRANSVLQRMQEANNALSSEFTELIRELPQPQQGDPEWSERVSRINELFKRTGDLADEAEAEIFGRKENATKDNTSPNEDPSQLNTVENTTAKSDPKDETIEETIGQEENQNAVSDAEFIKIEQEANEPGETIVDTEAAQEENSNAQTEVSDVSDTAENEPVYDDTEPDNIAAAQTENTIDTENTKSDIDERIDKIIAVFEAAKQSSSNASAEDGEPKRENLLNRLIRKLFRKTPKVEPAVQEESQFQETHKDDVVPMGATAISTHSDSWDESEDYGHKNQASSG